MNIYLISVNPHVDPHQPHSLSEPQLLECDVQFQTFVIKGKAQREKLKAYAYRLDMHAKHSTMK